MVKPALNKEEYVISCVQSSRDAIAIVKKKVVDVLITNLAMPEISGLELLQQARFLRPTIGIIVMVRNDSLDLVIKSFQAGAQAILVKPFAAQELVKVVEEVLEKSRLAKENMRLKTLLPLFEMNKSMVSELSEDKIFKHIIRLACTETRADAVSLMLLDEASNRLVTKATSGLSDDSIGGSHEMAGGNIPWSVAKTGSAVLVSGKANHDEAEGERQFPVSSLCVPLSRKGRVIGVINCTKVTSRIPFTEGDLELLSILAGQAAIAIENARLFDALKAHQDSLKRFLRKSLTGQEDERRRISAELHDGLAQWLISASYSAQTSCAFLDAAKPDEARKEIERANSIIALSIKELRHVILDLHPTALAELGLIGALRQNMEAFNREDGIRGDLRVIGYSKPLSLIHEVTIYRIITEALNNVRKHAQASRVEVVLRFEPEHVLVEVVDNGRGFDLNKVLKNEVAEGSIGLVTMKERAEMMSGSLRIETAPNKGTKVILELPTANYDDGHNYGKATDISRVTAL